jgi:hypothetical protein
MMGYAKLFDEIIHSTIWRAPRHVRLLWVTMLAIADANGEVMASIPGLADAARIEVEECEDALKILNTPDKYSRTQDLEGRRIIPIDGGWLLVNYTKYRKKLSREDTNAKNAERQARYRERQKIKLEESEKVTLRYALSRQAEADTKADAESKTTNVPPNPLKGASSDRGNSEQTVPNGEFTVSSPLENGGNPPDSLIPDSLIHNTTPKNPLKGSPSGKGKRRTTEDKLAAFSQEIVSVLVALRDAWPTHRGESRIQHDFDKAGSRLLAITQSSEFQTSLSEIQEAGLRYAEKCKETNTYANAIQFWLGPANGDTPPWQTSIRGLRTAKMLQRDSAQSQDQTCNP